MPLSITEKGQEEEEDKRSHGAGRRLPNPDASRFYVNGDAGRYRLS